MCRIGRQCQSMTTATTNENLVNKMWSSNLAIILSLKSIKRKLSYRLACFLTRCVWCPHWLRLDWLDGWVEMRERVSEKERIFIKWSNMHSLRICVVQQWQCCHLRSNEMWWITNRLARVLVITHAFAFLTCKWTHTSSHRPYAQARSNRTCVRACVRCMNIRLCRINISSNAAICSFSYCRLETAEVIDER